MIQVSKQGVLLKKTIQSNDNHNTMKLGFEPDEEHIHLFFRVAKKNNYSRIVYNKHSGPFMVEERFDFPQFQGQAELKNKHFEIPVIVKIDGIYYSIESGVDGLETISVLSCSNDLTQIETCTVISPMIAYHKDYRKIENKGLFNTKYQKISIGETTSVDAPKRVFLWDKNIQLFPRRIQGKLVFLHSVKPNIHISKIDFPEELTDSFWGDYFTASKDKPVLKPKHKFENACIGVACTPIETKLGWLVLYYAVQDTPKQYIHSVSACLLDLENPENEISRLNTPLFQADDEWYSKGEVNDASFPLGTVLIHDLIYIYYATSDDQIACATVSISKLLEELLSAKN